VRSFQTGWKKEGAGVRYGMDAKKDPNPLWISYLVWVKHHGTVDEADLKPIEFGKAPNVPKDKTANRSMQPTAFSGG
jgi:hypothetical protein